MLLLFSCSTKSDYQQMKERELAKNIRVDTLFHGLHLGMTNKAYFEQCHEMNRQQIFLHGSANTTVELPLETELKHPAKMSFFPEIENDKVVGLQGDIEYRTWSPWLKDRFSDHLLEDVLLLFEHWYGEGFLKVKHPKYGHGYVKVDGNRQILLERKDDRIVQVTYSDLTAEL